MTIKEPEISDEQDMICVCKPDGLIAAERRCVQALSMLGINNPSCLTETLIMSLAFEFSAEVTVFVDQWFGLDVEAPGYEASLIEADHPLDGLIEVYFRLAKRFPEKLQRPASDVSAVQEWAQRQIERVSQAIRWSWNRSAAPRAWFSGWLASVSSGPFETSGGFRDRLEHRGCGAIGERCLTSSPKMPAVS